MKEVKKYDDSNIEQLIFEDYSEMYNSADYPFKIETFKVIGACMKVHNELGNGFHEIVYKDALVIEFGFQKIEFVREKQFDINYKGIDLGRKYNADFLAYDNIIVEIKADQSDLEMHSPQVLNYLAVSKCKIALLVNFGTEKLKFKRIIL